MEYWEVTKDRAQKTLSVWTQYAPALKIGGQLPADLLALINQFEPLAQARTTKQDAADDKLRTVKTALLKMKILGTKVPQIIQGQVPGNENILKDLGDIFHIVPRSEPTILGRARSLYPVWVRADAALAALATPAPPITRPVQGVAQTAALLKGMLDGYTGQVQQMSDADSLLNKARGELRALDHQADRLAKNWYQVMKNTYDPGSPEFEALDQIPTEQGTPAPDPIDIEQLLQGGDDGLQVLVSYEQGGGAHATTKAVEYIVVGVDADFAHGTALDASGNALGPFTVGQVVKARTKVANSTGTRTSAVRTITIAVPIV